jgi:hypothetical protein
VKNVPNPFNYFGEIMKYYVVFAFMLFVIGCVEQTSLIPTGIYTSSELGSEERVEVKGSEIFFHIKIDGVFWDRQFDNHFVYSNGNIVLLPISSNEFHFLHSLYDLKYDGKEVLIEDIKTKGKISFVRE